MVHGRSQRRSLRHVLFVGLVTVVATASVAKVPTEARAATITLEVYDATGAPLSTGDFLRVLEAAPKGWRSDLAYRVADGTAAAQYPVYDLGGTPAFDTAEPGVGLTLAWPTAATGYSTWFLDNEGAGFDTGATVNFTYRLALDYRAKLDQALARRPAFTATAAFTAADTEASALISAATAAGDEPTRGAFGQQALDALARAFETLLHDYGLERARTESLGEWWGFTVDRTTQYEQVVASVADLVEGVPGRAYLRVVFDEYVPAEDYDGIVAAAGAAGVTVVGQLLDSTYMPLYDTAAVAARVAEYVDRFPEIEVWEIGNEVNGEWLGDDVAEKLQIMADYVKAADATDTTVLTFFWQMGTADQPTGSLFQWIADNVTPALAAKTDVVSLSMWPGGAPWGIAHDEVYERLAALFPTQQISMGELGYWSSGTTKAWWWRSQEDPQTTVRKEIAEHMYLANLAFPYSNGGVFWWYYYQEMYPMTELWQTVNEAYRSIYFCDDADTDTYCDFQDNCPAATNLDQTDTDGDGLGDVCDLACPAGERLDTRALKLKLKGPGEDQLNAKGFFTTVATLDPVADGLHLTLEEPSGSLLDVWLGGTGAPVPFEPSGNGFRYKDRDGQVAGISRVDVSPKGSGTGTYKLRIKGKRMTLPTLSEPTLRLTADLTSACIETHASDLECVSKSGGTKILCR